MPATPMLMSSLSSTLYFLALLGPSFQFGRTSLYGCVSEYKQNAVHFLNSGLAPGSAVLDSHEVRAVPLHETLAFSNPRIARSSRRIDIIFMRLDSRQDERSIYFHVCLLLKFHF